MKKALVAVCVAVATVVGTGCASSTAGDVYKRDETKRAMTYREGTLVGLKTVRVEGTKSGIGTVAGAAIGGVAGSGVGEGRGSILMAVVGAIAGGLIGAATEEGITREDAFELTVQLDDGKNLVVVQGAGSDQFTVGDRVRVIQGSGSTRVTK